MFFTAGKTTFGFGCAAPWAGIVLLVGLTSGCAVPGSWGGELSQLASPRYRAQSPEAPLFQGGTVPAADLNPPVPRPTGPIPEEEINSRPDAPARGPVLSVSIVGNDRVSESEILRHIKTRPERAYDPQLIQEDQRRLFATRKFHNVRVQKRVEPQGVHVSFEVVERALMEEVLFIGNRYYSDKKLLKESGMERGEPLNVYSVQEARRKLEEFYHSKGFAQTRVTILEGDQPADRRVVLQVDEGRVERIWDVNFEGNDPDLVSDARLETLIKSKPGILQYLFRGKVDHLLIEQDRQKLVSYYRGLGYMQARVSPIKEYDDSGQWLNLTFVIDEGPRYRVGSISVVGNKKYDSQALLDFLTLNEGEYFHQETMLRDENALRDLYGGRGHIFADINASLRFREEPGALDLVYQIEEGEMFRVGKINIHVAGESAHTRRDVILNRLSLQPGDIVDIREVRASERRLKASQLFVTNPAEGTPPRIVIRPPDLAEAASMAQKQGGYRGQSPDGGDDTHAARWMVLDVSVPPLRDDPR